MPISLTPETVYFTNSVAGGDPEEDVSLSSSIAAPMVMEVQLELGGESTLGTWTRNTGASRWYFRPGLFVPPGVQLNLQSNPATQPCYFVELPKSAPNAGYLMSPINCGLYTDQNRNFTASLEVRGDTTVILSLQFRMTMDLLGFLSGLGVHNPDRFIRSALGAPLALTNDVSSVYNLDRAFSWMLYATVATHTDPDDKVAITQANDFTSRWYLEGLYGGAPELDGFTCKLERNGIEVQDFSAFEPTKVICTWDEPGTSTPHTAYAYVLEVQSQSYINFLTDYKANGFTVVDNAFASQLDGFAYGPSEAINNTGSEWETTFHVRNVDPAKQYAVVIVVGMTVEASYNRTNSYIRYPIAADGIPLSNTLIECDGSISDYNRTEVDHVITTVVDRLRLRVEYDYTSYEAELPAWSAGSFLEDLNRVKLEVYVDGDFLYDVIWPKNASNGFNDAYLAVFAIDDEAETVRIDYTALMAYLNDLAGLEDWGGKTITYRWTLRLSYATLGGHSVDYAYEQKVVVQDYRNYAEVIEEINLFDYDTGLRLTGLCGVDKVLVEVLLDPAQLEGLDWDISAFASRAPHGYDVVSGPLSTQMDHGYPSPVGLPTGDSLLIEAVSNGFTANRATFVLDVSTLSDGEQWRVHAIARPQPEGS